ncbi:unnamed protein product, partial [Rotaria sordida]
MEEQIRSIIKFTGSSKQDVINWLQYIDEVFDGFQLQASEKNRVVSYFLTRYAAVWFKHIKPDTPDWPTFKREIIAYFSPSFSSFSSCSLDRHQLAIYEDPQKLEQEQDVPHVPASSSTMINNELENDDISLDLVTDNRINSFEDLEDKHVCECEQGPYSPTLVNINDRDLKTQHQDDCTQLERQGVNAADDCAQLEQQGESLIVSDSVKTDVDDISEGVTQTMDSLTADHSFINTVSPHDTPYLWFAKHNPRHPRILNKDRAVYHWSQHKTQHYHKDLIDTVQISSYSLPVWADHRDRPILQFPFRPQAKMLHSIPFSF